MVKLLETIPTFAAVIISILLGPLMKVFYKKQLLLFGIALSFFQFIPAIVPGFWPLFICRTVAGLRHRLHVLLRRFLRRRYVR